VLYSPPDKAVILSGRDFFFVFAAYSTSCIQASQQSRHPERSASQMDRVTQRFMGAESKDLGGASLTHAALSFSTTEARQQDLL
jgi:hypothetical protein